MGIWIVVLAALINGAIHQGETALEQRLLPLAQAHKGKVAIGVKHLKTGESYFYRQDEPQRTASLIKLPIMVEAYRQSAERKVDLQRIVMLHERDKVPGAGILTPHFSDGAQLPVRDLIRLMIRYSDNTATNLVIDQIGLPATSETMERLGYPNTKLHAKVFRSDTSIALELSKRFGLGSTTAGEMIRLLEELHHGRLVSPEACKEMLAHLKACDDQEKFRKGLPRGIEIAYKTGSVSNARTAAGIVYGPYGPVAICVLTDENEDQRWTDNAGDRLCADVARQVHEYFLKATTPSIPATSD